MFQELCNTPSDINEHLPTLRDLALECESVTEMGVRGIVSTYAWVEGLRKSCVLNCIDKTHPAHWNGNLDALKTACRQKNIDFYFTLGDTRNMTIGEVDLLFIDTQHTYEQLHAELELHGNKAKKYLVFHDTTSFGEVGDDGKTPALWTAIEEFLISNKDWCIMKRYTNNNGLTILKRC